MKTLAKVTFKSIDWTVRQCRQTIDAVTQAYKEFQEEKALNQQTIASKENPHMELNSVMNLFTNRNNPIVHVNLRKILRDTKLQKSKEEKARQAEEKELENMFLKEHQERYKGQMRESEMKDEAVPSRLKETVVSRKLAGENVIEEHIIEENIIEENIIEENRVEENIIEEGKIEVKKTDEKMIDEVKVQENKLGKKGSTTSNHKSKYIYPNKTKMIVKQRLRPRRTQRSMKVKFLLNTNVLKSKGKKALSHKKRVKAQAKKKIAKRVGQRQKQNSKEGKQKRQPEKTVFSKVQKPNPRNRLLNRSTSQPYETLRSSSSKKSKRKPVSNSRLKCSKRPSKTHKSKPKQVKEVQNIISKDSQSNSIDDYKRNHKMITRSNPQRRLAHRQNSIVKSPQLRQLPQLSQPSQSSKVAELPSPPQLLQEKTIFENNIQNAIEIRSDSKSESNYVVESNMKDQLVDFKEEDPNDKKLGSNSNLDHVAELKSLKQMQINPQRQTLQPTELICQQLLIQDIHIQEISSDQIPYNQVSPKTLKQKIDESLITGLLGATQVDDYIKYLNREVVKSQSICVLNVYFVSVVLAKQDKDIKKFLQRKGLSQKKFFYIPVHLNNHWFFVRVGANEILICDSLKRQSGRYLKMQPVYKIIKFSKNVLGRQLNVVIDDSFPRQPQSINCGFFMLSGLKDCIEGTTWSFTFEDISTKKAEIAGVLLAERVDSEKQKPITL